ncbi:hypothetical protein [Leucobacter sp.]
MNTTPRWLNRSILLVLGALFAATGAAALLLGRSDEQSGRWGTAVSQAPEAIRELGASTRLELLGHSWIWLVLLAALLLFVIIAVVVMAGQGGGRTSRIMRRGGSDGAVEGAVLIDLGLAEQSLSEAIRSDPDVLSVQVTGHTLRNTEALRISLAARRGASPARIARQVQEIVARWDEVFGAELPVVIDIAGGIRTRAGVTRGTR